MNGHQKRRAPRVPIEVRVEYQRVNAFIADLTRDVSGRGLFVRTDHPLERDTECVFTLVLPRMVQPLTLRGVVRRVVRPEDVPLDPPTPAPGVTADVPGMGVEFIFDDDAERDALRLVLDDLMVEQLGAALFQRMSKLRVGP